MIPVSNVVHQASPSFHGSGSTPGMSLLLPRLWKSRSRSALVKRGSDLCSPLTWTLQHGTPVRWGKPGYKLPTYVRIAVRDEETTEYLIDAWKEAFLGDERRSRAV